MRIGIVGSPHVGPSPDEYSSGKGMWSGIPDHSICSATHGIMQAFRKHGLDAFITHPRRPNFKEADALFICEFNFLERVAESHKWDFKKPTVLWLHSHYPGNKFSGPDLIGKCAGICFTRQEALDKFEENHGPGNYWQAPWAFPEWWWTPPDRPNPYNPETFNLIFAGRSAPKGRIPGLIRSVTEAFPQIEVHIFSDVGKSAAKDPACAQVVAEYCKNPNVTFYGSWNHGTFLNYIYYADLALDSGGVPTKIANNCKIWDYLAMGTPVVVDNIAGGVELIEETGCGIVVQNGKYLDAIWQGLLTDFPRKSTRQMMRQHTWEATVSQWINRFKEVL